MISNQLEAEKMDIKIIKFHTYPDKKLHTRMFTDTEKAYSFIESLKSNVNVVDYRVFETTTDIAEVYCDRQKDAPVKLINKLDKNGFTAIASRQETEDGWVYEAFLEHPTLGSKRVLYLHKKTVEELGLKSEKDIEDSIYRKLDYYIGIFRYEGDWSPLPTYLLCEEQNGYEVKWPPMAD